MLYNQVTNKMCLKNSSNVCWKIKKLSKYFILTKQKLKSIKTKKYQSIKIKKCQEWKLSKQKLAIIINLQKQ